MCVLYFILDSPYKVRKPSCSTMILSHHDASRVSISSREVSLATRDSCNLPETMVVSLNRSIKARPRDQKGSEGNNANDTDVDEEISGISTAVQITGLPPFPRIRVLPLTVKCFTGSL